MVIKQKTVTAFALLLTVGLTSALFALTFGGSTALAYTTDEDCGKYSSIGEEEACRAYQEANGGYTGGEEEDKPDCEPGSDGCCGGVKTSIIDGELCGDNSSSGEDGTVFMLLKNVLTILTAGIGIAAVGGIAYGALLYTTAESKPEQTKKAIGIITNVVIGIVAYGLMFVLLNFLIPGGVFT